MQTDQHHLADHIRQLLHSQVQCVLATQGEQHRPVMHLMAYAFAEDLATIYCVSPSGTRKVNNIQNNPAVSLLWDNRTGNTADHVQGFSLLAECDTSINAVADVAPLAQALLERNPQLTHLIADPQSLIFSFKVAQYIWVEGYNHTYCWQPNT